jgi:pimeloyl-ACP methyl ester carboxylesterase
VTRDIIAARTPPQGIDAWREAGAFFDFRGERVFYRREGRGAPLLLVHGYPTSSWDWARLWPTLTARFDVIAPDMLGFGYSAKPRGRAYSIAEQADLHLSLLAELGVTGPFHALVHDYGVTVGQELLARDAVPIASIAFLNGGLFPETHRPRLIQRVLASPLGPLVARLSTERTFARSFAAVFGPRTKPTPDEMHAFWSLASRDEGMRALAGLIAYMRERVTHRERWVGALVATRVPLLAINGVLDPVSGAHMIARLLELRPRTQVVRLDVGHYPQVEAPDDVLAAYLAFVTPLLETRAA